MKNKDYFKDQIFDILCSGDSIAVNKSTGEPFTCDCKSCANCTFLRNDRTSKSCAFDDWLNWLEKEYKESILSAAERSYLESIIRPFKDRVRSITKYKLLNDYAWLYLEVAGITTETTDNFSLPAFRKDGAYLGLEFDKEYTLKDLRLFKSEGSNEK